MLESYKDPSMLFVRLQLINPSPALSALETELPVLCTAGLMLTPPSDSALFPPGGPSFSTRQPQFLSPHLVFYKLPMHACIKHFLYILRYINQVVDICLSFDHLPSELPSYAWVIPPLLIFLLLTMETENSRYSLSQSSFQ